MENMTNHEYWKEVRGTADSIACEALQSAKIDNPELTDFEELKEAAEEIINDTLLHETIDGHQWVIYSNYNLDVIKNSDNQDYYVDNFGLEALGESAKSGLDTLHCHLAFWCLYADVQDNLEEALNEYESEYSTEVTK